MKRKEMNFDQFIDWAAGYILTRLIAGDLKAGVSIVLTNFAEWQKERTEHKEG